MVIVDWLILCSALCSQKWLKQYIEATCVCVWPTALWQSVENEVVNGVVNGYGKQYVWQRQSSICLICIQTHSIPWNDIFINLNPTIYRHPSVSSAYPRSGRGGSSFSKEGQTYTLASHFRGVPRSTGKQSLSRFAWKVSQKRCNQTNQMTEPRHLAALDV